MEDLIISLKKEIIEVLKLEGIELDEIKTDAHLFNEGLGLDSIDALELIVLLDKNYGIVIEDAQHGKEILTSVKTMAEYIQQNRKK